VVLNMVDDRFMFDSNIGKVAEPHDCKGPCL
jgi:hypothetical protein